MGSDGPLVRLGKAAAISIRAPRVGSDCERLQGFPDDWTFQSALPVWGATNLLDALGVVDMISIRAPRVGSDRYIL